MAIPSVMRGLIETESGKVFELNSPKGAAWLETVGSFRYEPTDGKPYTVRKEGKNGEYWYGCRKIEGTVRKKYIGKSSEVTVAKLEEIAEALENSLPPVSRSKKVAEVAEVAQVEQDRLATLELQMAMVLQAVIDLQDALPGKSDAGDSVELPEVDNEVMERLQNELSNLKVENDELRSQLAAEKTRWDELREELDDTETTCAELRSELSDLKQKSAPARDLPDAADLLNQLKKAKGKKSGATLADVEKILEILGGDQDD